MSQLRTLEEIRAAGAAAVADWPPLTDAECAELAFLISPHIATPAIPAARAAEEPAPRLTEAA